MTSSEIFHYPFYIRLIDNFEKKAIKAEKNTEIPECAFEHFKSEELLTLAITSRSNYVVSMKLLQQRIKPLKPSHLLIIEKFLSFSTDDALQRIDEFSNSAPIQGLLNPQWAVVVYERTKILHPALLKETYRASIKFLAENDYNLIPDETQNIVDATQKIHYPLFEEVD